MSETDYSKLYISTLDKLNRGEGIFSIKTCSRCETCSNAANNATDDYADLRAEALLIMERVKALHKAVQRRRITKASLLLEGLSEDEPKSLSAIVQKGVENIAIQNRVGHVGSSVEGMPV